MKGLVNIIEAEKFAVNCDRICPNIKMIYFVKPSEVSSMLMLHWGK